METFTKPRRKNNSGSEHGLFCPAQMITSTNSGMEPSSRITCWLLPQLQRPFRIDFPPVETVESILSDSRRKGLKAKTSLTSLLESFGIRYSPAVAERIALSMQAKDISEDVRNLLKALVFRIQQMSNSSDESG